MSNAKDYFKYCYQLERLQKSDEIVKISQHCNVVTLVRALTTLCSVMSGTQVSFEDAARLSAHVDFLILQQNSAWEELRLEAGIVPLSERVAMHKALKDNPELDEIPF